MTRFAVVSAAALIGLCAAAYADEDIIWVTYSQVEKPGDAALTCSALDAEIEHVDKDIRQMDKARHRVEQSLRSAFDIARYGGRRPGMSSQMTMGSSGEYQEGYAKAREQIVASKKVAVERKAHLESLKPACKAP